MQGGRYLLGTEVKSVIIKGTTCVVRIGGGFESMADYINRHQDEELLRIEKLIDEGDKSYV
jgi:hypothetical protein